MASAGVHETRAAPPEKPHEPHKDHEPHAFLTEKQSGPKATEAVPSEDAAAAASPAGSPDRTSSESDGSRTAVEDDGEDARRSPSVRQANERLERTLREARQREERLREHLGRLHVSTHRTERRLKEAVDGKENLENEVRALATLNGRLADELQKHQAGVAALEAEKAALEGQIEGLQLERFRLHRRLGAREGEGEAAAGEGGRGTGRRDGGDGAHVGVGQG